MAAGAAATRAPVEHCTHLGESLDRVKLLDVGCDVMKLPPAGGIHDEEEIEAVLHVLRTSNLDLGESVAALEAGVAELLAKRHGVMVNSGSSALRLAIDLLDLGAGDE